MTLRFVRPVILAAGAAMALALGQLGAHAQVAPPPTAPVVTAPLTVTNGAATLGASVVVNEVASPRPFSDSGEGKKALNAVGQGFVHLGGEIGKIMGW